MESLKWGGGGGIREAFFYTDSSHCGGKVGRPPKSWNEVLKNDFPE